MLHYTLVVEQQPIRARMCGFGDKDRRPITPPPCIRLVVSDAETGQEIDFKDIDSTFFVLMVDLWDEDAHRPVNLVRHSNAAPTVSISSSSVTAYPPPPDRPAIYMPFDGMAVRYPVQPTNNYPGPPHYAYSAPPNGAYNAPPNGAVYQGYAQPMPMAIPAVPITQNHTRNLIGMNAVNACRLTDPKGKTGFWFILQDLSVRTEGKFRLKMSMCDIGTGQGTNSVVAPNGKCPILANCFSEPFTVFSAKKFPGVIESTPLSKCFAQQGIKIPIRKDTPKSLPNQEEFDNDD
jgi:hypothetical protein